MRPGGGKRALQMAAFLAALLLLWQGLAWAGFWPRYLFPGPRQVFGSLWGMALDGSLGRAVLRSLGRLGLGYAISALAGTALGVLFSRFGWLEATLGRLSLGLQTLPSICWLPLALIWFGLNEKAILFVVVMGSVLSISMATESGVRHVPPVWIRAARTMGCSGARLYFKVVLPAAFPSILTGLKQGWSFAWRSLMAAELIYSTPGLGFLLNSGREFNDAAQVMAVIGVIIVLGTAINQAVFAPLEGRVRRRFGLD